MLDQRFARFGVIVGRLSSQIDQVTAKLEAELSVPLAADPDPASVQKLRNQMAQAESYSMQIATLRNQMAQLIDEKKAEALLAIDSELGDKAKTIKVAEKRLLINQKTAKLSAYQELLENTTRILERRVSAAQTLMNSINVENKTGWSGKHHEVNL